MTPTLHSLSSLARETGIDRRTLAKRLAGLPPTETDGRIRRWLLRDVLRELGARETAGTNGGAAARLSKVTVLDDQRARLTRARADLVELNEQERRGELVPAAQIQAFLQAIFLRVRQGILTLPSRTAPKAHDAKTIPQIERIILGDCKEVLQEISETPINFRVTTDGMVRSRARGEGIVSDSPATA